MNRVLKSFVQIVKIDLKKIHYEFLIVKQDHDHDLMKTAPSIIDYLNEESPAYFEKLKQYLTILNIPFEVDPNLFVAWIITIILHLKL